MNTRPSGAASLIDPSEFGSSIALRKSGAELEIKPCARKQAIPTATKQMTMFLCVLLVTVRYMREPSWHSANAGE